MMMNADDANSCSGKLPYAVAPGPGNNPAQLPPTPSLFLPVMEKLAGSNFLRSEQLGCSDSIGVNVPALLAPAASNPAAAGYINSNYCHDHDMLQFYPSTSHYLTGGNPYSHFSQSTFLTIPQYYFPNLLDENVASFGASPYAQLRLNSLNYGGYRGYYMPPRGRYAYGDNPLRCQVDGCTTDLSKAKRYHRRHKVCEQHSKAPVVIISAAIMPQRFCQQCSRFHEVNVFDDAKRSCRQRLADHNRRRRNHKPSSTDVPLKRRAHVKKSATAKDNKRNSSTSMGTGDVLGTQELGSASKEIDRRMDLGEAAREPEDPKRKAPMKKHAHVPQQNLQYGVPLLSSPDRLSQSQPVAGGNISNLSLVQEPTPALPTRQHPAAWMAGSI